MEYPQGTRRRRPVLFHGGMAFGLTVVLAVLLWYCLGRRWSGWLWLAAWLLAVNLITFVYYGFDKWRAGREGAGRVPELVLHALAVAGGSLGAIAAMRFFRHKTVKAGFRFVFGLIVFTHLVLIISVAYRLLVH